MRERALTRFVWPLLLLAGCQCQKPQTVLLPIADRQWEEGAPDEGWCGETSIQMVALHYGAWIPQPMINALGKPSHPDLWEEDLPTALENLGLKHERARSKTVEEFTAWIIAELRLGHPVIVGAKVFPTSHPDWDVDHLMPVVGFTSKGLMFNTNEEQGQVEIPFAALSGTDGISFMSPTKKFYGYAVSGFRGGGASLRVVRESADSVEFSVESDRVGLLQREDFDGGVSTSAFTPRMHVIVARDAAVRFTVR